MITMNTTNKVFREHSAVLVGEQRDGVWLLRLRRVRWGERSRVVAAWHWALRREEMCGDVLGFWHTHPPRAGTCPSVRDVRTMQAWCSALGKPLLCVIGCEKRVQSTLFADDEDCGRMLPIVQRFGGWIVVVKEVKNVDYLA
jgi:hypothetical protein